MQHEPEVSKNRKRYMMSSEKLVKPARTADDFFNRYSVADVQNAALKIRNPFSEALIRFAHEEGRRLTALIPNSEYKIGGSLGYNALLHDNYDLDLRLLLLGDATNSHIDAATLRLIEDGGYANPRFINEGGGKLHLAFKALRFERGLRSIRVPVDRFDVEHTIGVEICRHSRCVGATSSRCRRSVCCVKRAFIKRRP